MDKYIYLEKIIYIEKNYNKALEILNEENIAKESKYKELKAYVLFNTFQYEDASLLYAELKKYYETGLCYLFRGNIFTALDFIKNAEDSPAKNWSLFFCELFTDNITVAPTYLQIRAFLERDLTIFLKLELTDFVQKIIDISDYLSDINPSTNKYIAKVFLYNDYNEYALEYINRGMNITNCDAELYYLKALYYNKTGNKLNAIEQLENAINLNKNYIPAKLLLENINN